MRRLHAGLADNVLLIIDSAYDEFADQDDYEVWYAPGPRIRKCCGHT